MPKLPVSLPPDYSRYVTYFAAWLEKNGRGPTTINAYVSTLRGLFAEFIRGNHPTLLSVVDARKAAGRSIGSISSVLAAYSDFALSTHPLAQQSTAWEGFFSRLDAMVLEWKAQSPQLPYSILWVLNHYSQDLPYQQARMDRWTPVGRRKLINLPLGRLLSLRLKNLVCSDVGLWNFAINEPRTIGMTPILQVEPRHASALGYLFLWAGVKESVNQAPVNKQHAGWLFSARERLLIPKVRAKVEGTIGLMFSEEEVRKQLGQASFDADVVPPLDFDPTPWMLTYSGSMEKQATPYNIFVDGLPPR
jgi:hypothetical protein